MQIPWLFPIFIFSLTFNKIPWLFPDFFQVWNFPDFSLTAGHPEIPHDDVIKWKHFLRYWPFVRGIHLSPVNSPHKGQWRGALMFSLSCVWINGWVNNHQAGDFRRYRANMYQYNVFNCGSFKVGMDDELQPRFYADVIIHSCPITNLC